MKFQQDIMEHTLYQVCVESKKHLVLCKDLCWVLWGNVAGTWVQLNVIAGFLNMTMYKRLYSVRSGELAFQNE